MISHRKTMEQMLKMSGWFDLHVTRTLSRGTFPSVLLVLY